MKKELSKMTLEELWQIFPIILKDHNPLYKEWYELEKRRLLSLQNIKAVRINHIGSSAVKGLVAKPIVDILLEVDTCDINRLITDLKSAGWTLMANENKENFKLSFNKGYTTEGFAEKVYHLHVRSFGDHDELYFRDYLLAHPEIATEYANLKLSLWKKYEHNRDGYTEAKSDFILKATKAAREEFLNKYLKL